MKMLFLVLFLAAGPADSQQMDAAPSAVSKPAKKVKPKLSQWFKHWKDALEKSAVEGRYRRVRPGAVAAVRGTPQKDAAAGEIYWKSGVSDKVKAQILKERAELAEAAELILQGKLQEGRERLDAFEKAHPKSDFSGDVLEARAHLEELSKQAVPAPSTEAEPGGAEKPKAR